MFSTARVLVLSVICVSTVGVVACTASTSGDDGQNDQSPIKGIKPRFPDLDAATPVDAATRDDGGLQTPGDGGTTLRAFVTNQLFSGNFTLEAADLPDPHGRAGENRVDTMHRNADGLCNVAAKTAGLKGSFKAFVGSPAEAIARIVANGPWSLLTGEAVFANKAQLVDRPSHAIDVTETAFRITDKDANAVAWTFSNFSFGTSCAFGSSFGFDQPTPTFGTLGDVRASDPSWLSIGNVSCNTAARLYCLEDPTP